jgi:hypothetical protein
MDFLEVRLSPYDNTVVMVGLAQVGVKSRNGPIRFKARFTGVWAKQQGQWRFAAWQTTLVPEK